MAEESPERWRAAASLFGEVTKRPPDQQDAFLANACASDPGLLGLVRRLIDADRSARNRSSSRLAPSTTRSSTPRGRSIIPTCREGRTSKRCGRAVMGHASDSL